MVLERISRELYCVSVSRLKLLVGEDRRSVSEASKRKTNQLSFCLSYLRTLKSPDWRGFAQRQTLAVQSSEQKVIYAKISKASFNASKSDSLLVIKAAATPRTI
jgi:hypothetical protein